MAKKNQYLAPQVLLVTIKEDIVTTSGNGGNGLNVDVWFGASTPTGETDGGAFYEN